MRKLALSPLLLALAAPVAAEPGLPDEASVAGALDAHPSVLAARERVGAARAGADARAVGPHELTFTGSYTRRNIDLEGDFDEFDAQLTRAFRLPGKARLDRAIGTHQVDAAENMAEDARHQAALILARHWWDWLEASAAARVDERAVANYRSALNAVRRREELGDASLLEVDQAEAALGSARVLAEQSAGEAQVARSRLQTHFPSLAIPVEAPEVPAPDAEPDSLDRYRDLVIANSHEIAAAEAQARAMGSYAERTRMDRIADPSFGVRLFSERSGAERGAGLVFSIPLGGRHRGALADQAAAEAGAASADAALARFTVLETAETDLAEARLRLSSWQRAREALDAQMSALLRQRRGHELGEIDLADLLLAERMTHESFRTEAVARAAAQRAVTQLRIDSHELWLAD
ncbi:TolC family protein [Alteraurantiacibacter aquimixticola]|uniref:Transporter n=1 Tax=Alteraurantiacibacter aquimixticola TaxID=2489173 RepID=A0A4T3EXB2_9SPHN|nr:TolC family protein [Alteraurantiacibacter aquimixticola]TIX49235.1 transporter [Alteraurantiacibacter aquimixticola]